jgi:hypothetical protein
VTTISTPAKASWTPAWRVIAVALVCAILATAVRGGLVLGLQGWVLPLPALAAAFFVGLLSSHHPQPFRVGLARVPGLLLAAIWMPYVAYAGWTPTAVGTAVLGAGLLAGVGELLEPRPVVAPPRPANAPVSPAPVGERPAEVLAWETDIRGATGKKIVVTQLEDWANPADGVRVHMKLPANTTVDHIATAEVTGALQATRQLPNGCIIQTHPGDHQGAAIYDVMLRNSLANAAMPPAIDAPTSIYKPFSLVTDARGGHPEFVMRQSSMIVGGGTGAGKTTWLHRLIAHFAWCTDVVIWVLDGNGGGLGHPWAHMWREGKAAKPTVDWIASTPGEAALMAACHAAAMTSRKHDPEAVRRRRSSGDPGLLPVDAKLPAILLVTDEGGEMSQSAQLLARLAIAGIRRASQIGRAEGGRVIMSVLRGTADILPKGIRTMCNIRVALRMEEGDEYQHILDAQPPKGGIPLDGSKGYLLLRRTDQDQRPILARTGAFGTADIDRVSIATADLRPPVDARVERAMALVTSSEVVEGRDVDDEIRNDPALRDADQGLGYARRWERYAEMMDALEERPRIVGPRHAAPQPTSALDRVLAWGAAKATPAAPVAVADPQPEPNPDSPPPSPERAKTREQIMAILRDAAPHGLMTSQIVGALGILDPTKVHNRTYVQGLLADMGEQELVKNTAGLWYRAED